MGGAYGGMGGAYGGMGGAYGGMGGAYGGMGGAYGGMGGAYGQPGYGAQASGYPFAGAPARIPPPGPKYPDPSPPAFTMEQKAKARQLIIAEDDDDSDDDEESTASRKAAVPANKDGHHLHRLLVLPGECEGDHCTTNFPVHRGGRGGRFGGYGNGYGNGFGNGYGNGFGNGFGNGVGFGNGFGNGLGNGNGFANGIGGNWDAADCGHSDCGGLGFGNGYGVGCGGGDCGGFHDIHHRPIGCPEYYSPDSPCLTYPHGNNVGFGYPNKFHNHHPVLLHPTHQETAHHNIHLNGRSHGGRRHGGFHNSDLVILPHYGHTCCGGAGWNPYWGH